MSILPKNLRTFNRFIPFVNSKDAGTNSSEYKNVDFEDKFPDSKIHNLIIESISNGIIALDKEFKIQIINSFACNMFGIKNQDSVLDKHVQDLISDNYIFELINKTFKEGCAYSEELSLHNDSQILSITINAIKYDNTIIGVVLFIHDVTKIRSIEKRDAEFVSNVSHELKTPLTSIRGFIETLKNGALNDREVAYKFLDIIDIEAERLFFLINDILALSEMETMHQNPDISSIYVEDIVNDSVNILQGQADKKSISIDVTLEPKLEIKASKHKMMQLVLNLVDNSIKYSPEGGWIKISAFKSDDSITISFKDSGIGIPQEHIPRIFERFYRVDKGRSRSLGGTGLGLSIVKYITDAYNGKITVKSEVGKGSEFILTFPV